MLRPTRRPPARLLALGPLALALLSACARLRGPNEAPPPTPLFPPDGATQPVVQSPSDGSLWTPGLSASPWSDPVARSLYDLVFVNVREDSEARQAADTDLEREATVDFGIPNFFGQENEWDTINDEDLEPSGVDPEHLIRANSTSDFEGEAETNREATLDARISAQVVEVFPNGNLRLYGSQVVSINNENQLLTLEGIARPIDILPDNSIDSYLLAEARIEYTGRGVSSDLQRPGWGTRVLAWVWPF